MRYFRSFESYENIGNTKCPISTYPAKKVTMHATRAYVLFNVILAFLFQW